MLIENGFLLLGSLYDDERVVLSAGTLYSLCCLWYKRPNFNQFMWTLSYFQNKSLLYPYPLHVSDILLLMVAMWVSLGWETKYHTRVRNIIFLLFYLLVLNPLKEKRGEIEFVLVTIVYVVLIEIQEELEKHIKRPHDWLKKYVVTMWPLFISVNPWTSLVMLMYMLWIGRGLWKLTQHIIIPAESPKEYAPRDPADELLKNVALQHMRESHASIIKTLFN